MPNNDKLAEIRKISVAQLGARMHYAVPRIFSELGILDKLYTDTYIGNKPFLKSTFNIVSQIFKSAKIKKLLGRDAGDLGPAGIVSFDLVGFDYQRRLAKARTYDERMSIHSEVGRQFASKVAGKNPVSCDAIWAFNGAALEFFQWAKSRDKACILEQTMAPYHLHDQLMSVEMRRWPGWQPDMQLAQDQNRFGDREIAEWSLADRIICGSQFVVDGIAALGGPVEKCEIVPYAVDLTAFHWRRREPVRNRPIRVLFAGEVGLRKGVPYLLKALRALGPGAVQAQFVGKVKIPNSILNQYADVAQFLGVVPRQNMPEIFDWADVFVLPSIVEGSATVIYEAVASGLPVVCSPNSGALLSTSVLQIDCTKTSALVSSIQSAASHNGPIPPDENIRKLYSYEAYKANLLSSLLHN